MRLHSDRLYRAALQNLLVHRYFQRFKIASLIPRRQVKRPVSRSEGIV